MLHSMLGFLDATEGDGGGGYDYIDSSGVGWSFDGYGWQGSDGSYYDPSAGGGGDALTSDSSGWYNNGAEHWTDAGDYYYDDGQIKFTLWADGSEDGFDYATGLRWSVDAEGNYYGVNTDGSSYSESPDGAWSWNDAQGNSCSGDAQGNWYCSDGSGGGDWASAPAGVKAAKDAGQQQRASTGAGGNSGGSAAKQAAQQAAQKAAQNLTTPTVRPTQAGIFSASDIKTLVYAGLLVGALVLLKK